MGDTYKLKIKRACGRGALTAATYIVAGLFIVNSLLDWTLENLFT